MITGLLGGSALFWMVASIILLRLLIAARRKYSRERIIMEKLPLRYFVADAQGNVLHYALGDEPGFSQGEIRTLADLPDQQVNRIMTEKMPEVLQSGIPATVDFEFNHTRRTACISKLPPEVFQLDAAVWVSHSSEELYRAKETAEQNAARLDLTLRAIGDGVIVTDAAENISLVNPVAATLLAMPEERLLGQKLNNVFHVVHNVNNTPVPSPVTRCIQTGKTVFFENHTDLVTSDGNRYQISDSALPIRNAKGKVDGAVLVFRDITNEYSNREQLHDSVAQFTMIMENFPAHIVAKDIDNNMAYTTCSKFFADMIGRSREDIVGHRDHEFFSNEDELAQISQADNEALRLNRPIERIMNFTSADGKTHVGHFHLIPMKFSRNRHWLFLVVDDITELYHAKTRTEELAERLNLTLRSIGDGVLATDPQGNITMLNPIAERMMGCSLAEVTGKPHTEFFKIVNAADRWPTPSPLIRSLRTGEVVEMANHTDLLSSDGRCYHIADSSAPIRDHSGKIIGGILIFRDVTEDYNHRAKLYNLNTLLSSLMANLPAELFLKDVDDDFRYLRVNWGLPQRLNLPAAEIVGKTDFELFPAEDAARFRADDLRAIQSGELIESTTPYRHTNDNIIYIRFYRKMIINADGKRLLLGIVVDTTEQEQQKQELERQKVALAQYNDKLQQFIKQDKLLNVCLEELLVNDDFSAAFRKLADLIGMHLHASTVLIDRYVPGEDSHFKAQELWQAESTCQTFPYEKIMEKDFPAAFAHLRQGGFIHFSLWQGQDDALFPWQLELNNYFKQNNIQEVICIPLMHRRKFWGYFGAEVQDNRYSFGSAGERMMSSAAHLLEILLLREESIKNQRRVEEEKLMILNVLPIPVVLLDNNYMVQHANAAAAEMVGTALEDFVGKSCQATNCRRAELDERCPVWLTLRTGQPQSMESYIKGRTYMVNTMPLLHDGKIDKILKIYIDLTEINHSKELLQEAVERAEAAAKSKSQFLATMSHEIRTPLNAVVGFSELLQDTEMTESEHKEYLHSINLAGNALLNLINDILDLSKLEADQVKLSPRPCELNDLIAEMQSIFRHRLLDKHLTFTILGANELPCLMLDQQRLRQILLNLIGNAIKFTHSGGITLESQFDGDDNAGILKIMVGDTGIGISESEQKRIFEPFIQAENARDTHNQSGTGLGLSIAKRLIENMGGSLSLKSTINQGSCFTITLPVQSCDSPKRPERPAANAVPLGQTPSSCRILIVDDVAMNLKVLGAMLQKAGYQFEATTSPFQAMELLKRTRFDIVLTDLWMPEMNGGELANKIKAAYPDIPVYATTADVDSKETFNMNLFAGTLTKPISFEKLQMLFKH